VTQGLPLGINYLLQYVRRRLLIYFCPWQGTYEPWSLFIAIEKREIDAAIDTRTG